MKRLLTISLTILFLLCAAVSFSQETSSIEKRLTDLLKETYGGLGMQVKLESIPAHLNKGVKVKSVSVHKVPDIRGKGLAVVEFEGEDGKLRASYVSFRIYEKRKLFYAKRALHKGTPVGMDDLGSKEAIIGESELIYPKDLQDVVGKVVRKDVAAGTIFTNQVLDSPQVVRRGEVVTIIGESQQLSVRAKGRAEEPGRLGERIRVRNLSSDREIVGTVAENRVVVVEC
jgi:flagella basal body P-ring formation protein FlgA